MVLGHDSGLGHMAEELGDVDIVGRRLGAQGEDQRAEEFRT